MLTPLYHRRSYRFGDLMKFFDARRTAYRTSPRQIDDVIYTTYSYGSLDPPTASAAIVDENGPPMGGGRLGGGGGRAARRGRASVKWRSSGSDGETTAATAVEMPDRAVARTGTVASPPAPPETGDLLGVPELTATDTVVAVAPPTAIAKRKGSKWDTAGTGEAEIFLFLYGTVVIWGMTEQQEKRFLSSL
jgi:uncharacterized Rmd1/YagE family protein